MSLHLRHQELAIFDASELSPSYEVINSDGLSKSCTIMRITNGSDRPITISFDGITDHEYLLPNSIYEVLPMSDIAMVPKGSKVWVSGKAGKGFITVSGHDL